ncbi:hypothetical protein [Ferrimonas sp. YFM]|uniref:hypothetical protein n=1 Tax=Ferrimonas sp. YFM TaxID=3028878 RepID=UPI00257314DC|nr:hypothetical protein [Ferrimonas sp. YFM]BDY04479.1 hypothetical protein F0521_15200 [Ferrimonas sp. YFM]
MSHKVKEGGSLRIYHWVYMALLLLLALGRLFQKVSTDTGGPASRYLPLMVAVLLALGVMGYVRQRPIFRRHWWRALFWLLSVGWLSLACLTLYLLFALPGGAVAGAGVSALVLLAISPGTWAIYQYAYCCPKLWPEAGPDG